MIAVRACLTRRVFIPLAAVVLLADREKFTALDIEMGWWRV